MSEICWQGLSYGGCSGEEEKITETKKELRKQGFEWRHQSWGLTQGVTEKTEHL